MKLERNLVKYVKNCKCITHHICMKYVIYDYHENYINAHNQGNTHCISTCVQNVPYLRAGGHGGKTKKKIAIES